MTDLNAALSEAFARHGDAAGLISPDGQTLTFSKIDEMAWRFAHLLAGHGVGQGSCVMVLVDNNAIQICQWIALMRLGAVPVMSTDLKQILALGVDVTHVIGVADQQTDGAPFVLFDKTWMTGPSDPLAAVTGPGPIYGSSGATGTPKYMQMAGAGLLSRVNARLSHIGGLRGAQLITMKPVMMVGLQSLLMGFLSGNLSLFKFETPTVTLQRMAKFNVRDGIVTPLYLQQLVKFGPLMPRLPDVQRLIVGGASVAPGLLAQAAAVFDAEISYMLGASEVGLIAGEPLNANKPAGFLGKTLKDQEVCVRDAHGNAVPPTEAGYLSVRIPADDRPKGYIGGAEIFDSDGWFVSGDIATLTPDGDITLLGRADDLINLGGNKTMPSVLERRFGDLFQGATICAFGLPNDDGFHDLAFAIEADEIFDAQKIATTIMQRFGTGTTVHVRQMRGIPLTRGGKFDRSALIALFAA